MSEIPETRYRPDIDGLRAVAVMAVVAFHVGLPWITGGFVGVDIFFVISGYLITGLLLQEAEQHGHVRLAAFFARRVRRLMPALVAVLLVTFAASLLLMFPQELPRLGKSGMSVALIASNFHFLQYSGGYFDPSTDLMPLLHTWSLAVEEQYYLLWPLLFVVAGFWARKRNSDPIGTARTMLWVVLLASFAFSIAEVSRSKSAAFYLMPFRAWEFALGGLLNFQQARLSRWGKTAGNALFATGSALVLGSFVLFGEETRFPGLFAAVPTFGTAAIIAAGMVANATWPRHTLGARWMVSIGLLSYSWYLWHWPLLSLNRAYNLGVRSIGSDTFLALLALALAWTTYRAVEAPIRFRRPWLFSSTRGTLWLGGAMSVVVILSAAGVSEYGKRAAAKLADSSGITTANGAVSGLAGCRPGEAKRALDPVENCTLGAPERRPVIAAWGDSHIEHWKPALAGVSSETGMGILMRTLNTCPPLMGAVPYKRSEGMYGCGYNNDNVVQELRTLAGDGVLRGVILGARWNEYLALQETDPGAILAWALADNWRQLELSGGGRSVGTAPYDHDGSATTMAVGLRRTLITLTDAGLRVLIVAPVPELYFNGPQCLYRHSAAACTAPRAKVADRRRAAMAAITTARTDLDGVRVWDPIDEFCDDRLCYAQRDGLVMYSDHNHIAPRKAATLQPILASHISWLGGQAD